MGAAPPSAALSPTGDAAVTADVAEEAWRVWESQVRAKTAPAEANRVVVPPAAGRGSHKQAPKPPPPDHKSREDELSTQLLSLRISSAKQFTCAVDGKQFRSQKALAQHTRDAHTTTSADADITGLLSSLRVVSFTCAVDGKTFRSQLALAQHTRDSHRTTALPKADSIDPSTLPLPVSSPGSWVPADAFLATGRKKSFGYFVCEDCHKWWVSAHAQRKPAAFGSGSYQDTFYFQECKTCCCKELPKFMWLNEGYGLVEPGADGDKPHEAALCEACQLGVCKMGTPLPPLCTSLARSNHFQKHQA